MKEFYTIEDVVLMTGLSERTVRSHIANGFLTGDKSTGAWRFTDEQLASFFAHPAVQPGIHAKKNALVYDFLAARPAGRRMCVLLDLGPEENGEAVTMALCGAMNQVSPASELRFAAEKQGKGTRIILTGGEEDVRKLLDVL